MNGALRRSVSILVLVCLAGLSLPAGAAYTAPRAQPTTAPNIPTMSFKKGPQGLNVFITPAPAQANATSVSDTALALQIC